MNAQQRWHITSTGYVNACTFEPLTEQARCWAPHHFDQWAEAMDARGLLFKKAVQS